MYYLVSDKYRFLSTRMIRFRYNLKHFFAPTLQPAQHHLFRLHWHPPYSNAEFCLSPHTFLFRSDHKQPKPYQLLFSSFPLFLFLHLLYLLQELPAATLCQKMDLECLIPLSREDSADNCNPKFSVPLPLRLLLC